MSLRFETTSYEVHLIITAVGGINLKSGKESFLSITEYSPIRQSYK